MFQDKHRDKSDRRSTTPPLIERKQKRIYDTDSDFEYVPKKSKQIESDDEFDRNPIEKIDDRSDRKSTIPSRPETADSKMKEVKRPPKKEHKKEVQIRVHEHANEADDDYDEDDDDDDDEEEFRPSQSKGKSNTARVKVSGNKSKDRKPDTVVKSRKTAPAVKGRAGKKSREYLKEKNKAIGGRSKKDRKDKARHQEKKEAKEEELIKQCCGPACVQSALKGSKYCGEECGLRLARSRILTILPDRIRGWKVQSCKADESSQRELEQVRVQQLQAKRELEDLDAKQSDLESIIDQSKQVRPLSEEECNDLEAGEADVELSLYCVTCGHEISYKNALRHMERCFNKFESQTSFGSVFKTKTEGVFCDYFNANAKTFCKRLKVLCPEHSKESRAAEDEVCGAPLTTNCFELSGEFCRLLKKKCLKHHGWEKLRRAELDMQRVNLWLKMDELFEQEQKIRFQMANRGGVIGLLLHQTIAY
jgi:hypothetical protein